MPVNRAEEKLAIIKAAGKTISISILDEHIPQKRYIVQTEVWGFMLALLDDVPQFCFTIPTFTWLYNLHMLSMQYKKKKYASSLKVSHSE